MNAAAIIMLVDALLGLALTVTDNFVPPPDTPEEEAAAFEARKTAVRAMMASVAARRPIA